MNFEDLKTELFARGTNYLEESAEEIARGERWLNQGYREICNLHAWSFLEADSTGPAPLNIPDLRKVISVQTADFSVLRPDSRRNLLVDDGVDLTLTGAPERFYIEGTEVKTFPSDGGVITVRYLRRVAPLTGTDTPIFDEEYHNLIVDKAMVKAYIDGDNFEAAAALRAEIDLALASMAEDYLLNTVGPQYIQVTEATDG